MSFLKKAFCVMLSLSLLAACGCGDITQAPDASGTQPTTQAAPTTAPGGAPTAAAAEAWLLRTLEPYRFEDIVPSLETHTPGADKATFVFRVTYRDGYALCADRFTLTYRRNSGTWQERTISGDHLSTEWDITGTWSYASPTSEVTLTVYKVDKKTIKAEYRYDVNFETVLGRHEKSGASSRVEELTFHKNDGEEATFTADGQWFYIDRHVGISLANDTIVLAHEDKGYRIPAKYHWKDAYLLNDDYAAYFSDNHIGGNLELSDYGGTVRPTSCIGCSGGAGTRGTRVYDLYGQYKTLAGTLFLNKYAVPGTSAVVRIYGDGRLLYQYDAAAFTAADYEEAFAVDVTGVQQVTFDMPGDIAVHPTDWIGMEFEEPLVAVSEVFVCKTDYYDAVELPLPTVSAAHESTLQAACLTHYARTGVRPYFVAVPYDAAYFELNADYDYVPSDAARAYVASDSAVRAEGDAFVIYYFSDERDKDVPARYFLVSNAAYEAAFTAAYADAEGALVLRVAEAIGAMR